MSLTAMVWALKKVQVGDPTAKLVLQGLADHASDDGSGAWPSHQTLAVYAEASTRTVTRKVQYLEDRGLIRRGDQELVAHLPANRRPVVWDLAYARVRVDGLSPQDGSDAGSLGRQTVCPDTSDVSHLTRQDVCADTPGHLGVTLLSDKPSLEPTNSSREVTTSRRDKSTPSPQEHQGTPTARPLPHPDRCRRHQTDEDPGPCGACGTARRAHQDAVQADELAARRRHAQDRATARAETKRVTREAIEGCPDCDDIGRLPSRELCLHDGGKAAAAAAAGAAAARQLLTQHDTSVTKEASL